MRKIFAERIASRNKKHYIIYMRIKYYVLGNRITNWSLKPCWYRFSFQNN